ncbi:MAG TPA: hypothetical protein PKA88_21790 [Polyangiaceae bacterium]|nr:hypothetical protein [Polyangiaceae bacterium]
MSEPSGESQDETDAPAVDEREAPVRASKPKKKKKKKKKKQPADASARQAEPARTADGVERPQFLLGFPEDPELKKLSAAFESGDYATVRAGVPALIEKSKKRAVREAAEELLRRTQPDPLMKYLLLASVVLLVFLTMHSYFRHGH